MREIKKKEVSPVLLNRFYSFAFKRSIMSPSVFIKVEAIYQMRHAASFFTDAVDLQTHFNVHSWWS